MREATNSLWDLVEKLLGKTLSLKDARDQRGAVEQAKAIN